MLKNSIEAGFSSFIDNRGKASNPKERSYINKLEKVAAQMMVEILNHPEFHELIQEGKITFGAIKPRAHLSKLPELLGIADDIEGEKAIRDMIKPPLKIIAGFSLQLTPEDVDYFYEEQKAFLENIKLGDTSVWESYKQHMLSGPVTYFLLYDEKGNAVMNWRNQMGETNPERADPASIRGRFASETQYNLVHGSSGDTKEERIKNVTRESDWFAQKLYNLLTRQSE